MTDGGQEVVGIHKSILGKSVDTELESLVLKMFGNERKDERDTELWVTQGRECQGLPRNPVWADLDSR